MAKVPIGAGAALSDVKSVIETDDAGKTVTSLKDAIDNDAVTEQYDGQYYATPSTSLREFQNYGPSGTTVLSLTEVYPAGEEFWPVRRFAVLSGASVTQNVNLRFKLTELTTSGGDAYIDIPLTGTSGELTFVNDEGFYNQDLNLGGDWTFSLDFVNNAIGDTATVEVQVITAAVDDLPVPNPIYLYFSGLTGPTPAPTNLTEISDTPTTITMSWDSVTDADGYQISQDGGAPIDVGNTLTATTSGLTCNATSYDYRVRGYNTTPLPASIGAWSSIVAMATEADTTAPSVPTGLAETADSNTSISMSWNASTDECTGIARYDLSIDGGGAINTGSDTTHTATGLSCDTSYGMRIRAVDGAGNPSAYSSTVNMSTNLDSTPPSVPTGLAKVSSTANSITVSYNASTDDVCGVYYYKIFYNATQYNIDFSSPYTKTGLACDTSYNFQISAVDYASNESAKSSIVAMSTDADVTAPSVPTGLAKVSSTDTTITMSWNASTDACSGVKDYYIAKNDVYLATITSPTTSYTATGLACNATAYNFKVLARDNSLNQSSYSANVNMSTDADTTNPSTPTGLAKDTQGDTTIDMSWNTSTDDCSGIDYYEVSKNDLAPTNVGNVTSWQATSLTFNTCYNFKVRAVDVAGNTGSYSANVNMCTNTQPVNLLTISDYGQVSDVWQRFKVGNNNVSPGHDFTVRCTLTARSFANPGVTYIYGVGCGGCGNLYNVNDYIDYVVTSNTSVNFIDSLIITDESGGDTATVKCDIIYSSYDTIPSPSYANLYWNIPCTAPPVPTGLAEDSDTTTSITMSWNSSAGADYYEISKNDAAGSTQSSPYEATGLACDETSYNFKVRACINDCGGTCSAWSSNVAMSTEADTTVPSTVTGLSTGTVTTTSIPYTWNAASDDCSGIAEYDLVDTGGSPITTLTGSPPTPSYNRTSLTAGTTYTLKLRAKDGAGNYSVAYSSVDTTCTLCVAPTLSYVSKTSSSVTVSWNSVGGASSYTLYYRATGGSNWIPITSVTSPKTVGSLGPSVEYEFIVVALNCDGVESANSNTITQTTDAADTEAPSVPSGLEGVDICQTTFTFNWNASTDNVAVTGYKVWKDGGLYSDVGLVLTKNITGQSAGVGSVWQVSAYDAIPNESNKSPIIVVIQSQIPINNTLNASGQANPTNACNATKNTTRYRDGAGGADPSNGDTYYTDTCLQTVFNGGGSWWATSGFAFQVSSVGVVSNRTACI